MITDANCCSIIAPVARNNVANSFANLLIIECFAL